MQTYQQMQFVGLILGKHFLIIYKTITEIKEKPKRFILYKRFKTYLG